MAHLIYICLLLKIIAVTLVNASSSEVVEVIETFEDVKMNSVTYKHVKLENMTKNLQIKVLFELNA